MRIDYGVRRLAAALLFHRSGKAAASRRTPYRASLAVAALFISGPVASAQTVTQTPPVMPKTQETPLPPPVTLPPPPGPLPADVPNRPLTSDEAVRIALRHQPNVAAAVGGVTAAAGRTQQARSDLLPQLGVSAAYSRVQALNGTGTGGGGTTGGTGGGSVVTPAGYQASGNLRQLIFDFNHTRDLVRQAAEEQRAAGANLTRVQYDLALQVKQAFYTLVQDQRLVSVNESNVRNQQSHLDLARARLSSGLGLPSDVVRAETAVADAIFNLNQARNNTENSRVALALTLGVDPRTPIVPAESAEPSPPSVDVNGLVNQALTARPEVVQAQATVKAAEHGVSAAATTSAPSLAGNLGLATRGSTFPPDNNSWSIGASINWPLFDSGFTAGRVREARGNLDTARAQLESAKQGVISDVGQAYLNLVTAQQRVATADSEVANAQESVRLAEGRFRAGLGTFIDVTDAQSALLTAQTNRVNALSAVDQARAALRRAIGAPVGP